MLLATGHGRDGVLLAPLTADLVAAALAGAPADGDDALLALCRPDAASRT